jgi:uncharacterized membrane protein YphA (DoxX/SURF4 family)
MKISLWTAFFLILLRLVIGWHFFFEGSHKVHSTIIGPTEANRPFSSAGYFREAPGPLAKVLRQQIGDSDDLALARLSVEPIPAGKDPKDYPPHERIPPALKKDWEDFVRRFADHYQLDEQQKELAQKKLLQAEDNVVNWLTKTTLDDKTKEVEKSYPSGTVKTKQSIPKRIEDYRAALQDLHDTVDNKLFAFGHDVEGKRLPKTKADVGQLRSGLVSELDEQTAELEKSLTDLLTPEQKTKDKMPPAPPKPLLGWIDWITEWGLTVTGACLLVGLFTRLNCILAAGFLLMTYLCAPPFPWLPVPPNSEGYYFYVNKNVIEMVALLALATTHSGRWLGLDALIHFVTGRRRR